MRKDKEYYEAVLAKLYKDGIAPAEAFKLKECNDGRIQVVCRPCSNGGKERLIEAGAVSKALSNVKAHIKTPSHARKVKCFTQNAEKSKEDKLDEEIEITFQSRFQEVDEKYSGEFELLQLGAQRGQCRCKTCNQTISLMPHRGNYMHNIEAHKASCKSTRRADKRKQSSLEGFFQPAKRSKPQ